MSRKVGKGFKEKIIFEPRLQKCVSDCGKHLTKSSNPWNIKFYTVNFKVNFFQNRENSEQKKTCLNLNIFKFRQTQ